MALFLTLTNLSRSREVEVTHVWLDTAPPLDSNRPERRLPRRLQPDETWETSLFLDGMPEPAPRDPIPLARARLSSGRTLRARLKPRVSPVGSVPG